MAFQRRKVIGLNGLSSTVTAPADGAACIILNGDLDLATRDWLRADVRRTLARYEPTELVIDLAEVKLLDSAGIGALVGAWKEANSAGCRLVLRNPRPLAYWQLQLTGLLEMFGSPDPPPGTKGLESMFPSEVPLEP
jgi:anti-sigma B factor antagonist